VSFRLLLLKSLSSLFNLLFSTAERLLPVNPAREELAGTSSGTVHPRAAY